MNNAGVQRLRPALELTEDDWDFVLDTNLRGAFFVAQAVGRGMVARGYGRIVNVASMSAFKATPRTRRLQREQGRHARRDPVAGHRMGAVRGPRQRRRADVRRDGAGRPVAQPPRRPRRAEAAIPIRRLPSVDEVAAAVAFLVSPDAGAINGTVLGVDGGLGAA